jgi:hypothetical protein
MELYSVAFLVKAEDLDQAKSQTMAFFDGHQPGHQEQAEQLFPTALSPSGQNPPTHFLCFMRRMTKSFLDATVAFRDAHSVPLAITPLGEVQSDTSHAEADGLRDAWLSAQRLAVIGEPG